jgi:hypothetical protein
MPPLICSFFVPYPKKSQGCFSNGNPVCNSRENVNEISGAKSAVCGANALNFMNSRLLTRGTII